MADVSIHFDPIEGGVAVLDPIEYRKLRLYPADPDFHQIAPEGFLFPVNAAIAVETDTLRFERMEHLTVWSADGTALETVGSDQRQSYDEGEYQIEISAPIKLYIALDGPFTVDTGVDRITFERDRPGAIHIGARSYHEHPAATITVGDDPEDAMAAISAFSSALKTTTPDVSFPTLRGHPPRIEYGDSLSIPDGLTPPETGIRIIVPPTRRQIYPTASLAFYLGAQVVPGRPPRIETERGFTYDLDSGQFLEDEIAQVVRQVLLFDGVVRAGGNYGQPVYEERFVAPRLDAELSTIFEMPVAERLERYLQVDFDSIRDVGPRWPMTAYVPPTGTASELLPHIVNELGIIRSPRGTKVDDREARETLGLPDDQFREYLTAGDRQRLLVKPNFFDDSIEHVWFGDHVPVGATKGTIEAFETRLHRPGNPDSIDIAVVAGTPTTYPEEAELQRAYEIRDDLSFDIDTFVEPSTDELAYVLGSEYDFVHFIGERHPGELATADGELVFEDLESVNLGAFLLEADHSFEEALWLARNGALGGIGVVGRVGQNLAIAIGRSLAYLLSLGFQLRAALDIVRTNQPVGDQYVIVGNGSAELAQAEVSMAGLADVSYDGETYAVELFGYPNGVFRVGSSISPYVSSGERFLGPGSGHQRVTVSPEELHSLISGSQVPVRFEGSIYWRTDEAIDALGIE